MLWWHVCWLHAVTRAVSLHTLRHVMFVSCCFITCFTVARFHKNKIADCQIQKSSNPPHSLPIWHCCCLKRVVVVVVVVNINKVIIFVFNWSVLICCHMLNYRAFNWSFKGPYYKGVTLKFLLCETTYIWAQCYRQMLMASGHLILYWYAICLLSYAVWMECFVMHKPICCG